MRSFSWSGPRSALPAPASHSPWCMCSLHPLPLSFSLSLSVSQLSLTVFLLLPSSPSTPPTSTPFTAFDYRQRPRTHASKSIGISSPPGMQSLSHVHTVSQSLHTYIHSSASLRTHTHTHAFTVTYFVILSSRLSLYLLIINTGTLHNPD